MAVADSETQRAARQLKFASRARRLQSDSGALGSPEWLKLSAELSVSALEASREPELSSLHPI